LSNLLKVGTTISKSERIIDYNDIIKDRVEAARAASRQKADSDGFINGLNADVVERLPEDEIDTEAAASEEMTQESAEAARAEAEEILAQAKAQAEEILAQARQKALDNEAKIIAEAKEEAARILSRANAQVELERKAAADDMKKEMIALASLMAEKAVAGAVDAKVQDTMVESTLKEIGEDTWRK